MSGLRTRPAEPRDAATMAAVYREGIEDRVATFETRPASEEEMAAIAGSSAPVLVAERDGALVGWVRIGPYSDPHDYYAGVGEATLYVARGARGAGVGRELMLALDQVAVAAGYHKLVGKIFTTNAASIALVHACGWHDVGVHRRHGRLDDDWKDVLVVEKLLG